MNSLERQSSERGALCHLTDNQLPEHSRRPLLHWKKRKCLTFMENARRQEIRSNNGTAAGCSPGFIEERFSDENWDPKPSRRLSESSHYPSGSLTADSQPSETQSAGSGLDSPPLHAPEAGQPPRPCSNHTEGRGDEAATTVAWRGCLLDERNGTWLAVSLDTSDPNTPLPCTIGRFSTAEEAARAYDVHALRHDGDEAVLNFASTVISRIKGSVTGAPTTPDSTLAAYCKPSKTPSDPPNLDLSPATLPQVSPRTVGHLSWSVAKRAWAVSCPFYPVDGRVGSTFAYLSTKAAALELSHYLQTAVSSPDVLTIKKSHDKLDQANVSPQCVDGRRCGTQAVSSKTSPSTAEVRWHCSSTTLAAANIPATPRLSTTKPPKRALALGKHRHWSSEKAATKVGRVTGPRRIRFPAGFLARPSSKGKVSRHHGVLWSAEKQSWLACVWTGRSARVVGVHPDESSAAALAAKEAAELSYKHAASRLPYSGVSWCGATGRWTACHMQPDTRQPRWLGLFTSATEAMVALDAVSHRRTLSTHNLFSMQSSCSGEGRERALLPGNKRRLSSEQSGEPRPAKTPKQQQQQQQRFPSAFRGVSVSDAYGKWRAQVWDGAKVLYIGSFDSEEAAARAYDLALLRLRGSDKALRTNFPISDYADTLSSFASDNAISSLPGVPSASLSRPGKASTGQVATPVVVLADRGKIRQTATCLVDANAGTEVAGKQRVAQASKGSSAFKGVSWSERSAKWRAQIWHGGRVHHLGFFEVEADAARAFDVKAREFRGARAVTNFASTGVSEPNAGERRMEPTPGKAATEHMLEPSPAPSSGMEAEESRRSSLLSQCPHANILGALNALSPAKATVRLAY